MSRLLSPAVLKVLIANGRASLADEGFGPLPIAKLFTPDAGATWLLSEIDPADHERAFGLCSFGLGCPELGWISLSELVALQGRLGLPVERDRHWRAERSLSYYAAEARALARINA